ncbi:MAG TPA: hypothetical protein VK439_09705, partial [Rubrivivax sp.]|nr:hypothetical protein [Rubrivivax sp.]
MTIHHLPRLAAVALATAGLSFAAVADNVRVLDEGQSLSTSIFPSDRFTVPDFTQRSFRRVNLPKPNCAVRPSDCVDIDVINQLDGFSTQPRITVPFSGAIHPSSVTSDTVYLINLGDTLTFRGFGERVGINQVVWDPARQTLSFESDQLLQEHSRYLLVVTDGVLDGRGKPIKKASEDGGANASAYQRELHAAGLMGHRGGRHKVVAASLFTTQSATSDMLKIMRQVKAGGTPQPVSFMIGNSGGAAVRAVFPLDTLQGIQFVRQTGAAPAFTPSFVPTPALNVVPGAVAAVAYGSYRSPNYLTAGVDIPPTPTWLGQPKPLGSNELVFQLIVPAGPKPAGGWPVAIFGHGFGDTMYGAPMTVAATFASQGIATLSINVVGHAGGPLGTLNVLRPGMAPVVVPAGGRGFDQDGNGAIAGTEGSSAAPPRAVIGSRDALRQTVIDLMQLVRQVQAGIDIDGDGSADLDPNNIHYSGQSFGGIYGTIFLGVEPNIVAGVPNVPGGSI